MKSGSNHENTKNVAIVNEIPPEEMGRNFLKNTVRKATMTLWSVDVCVTSMKIVDGKHRFKPIQELLLAVKAVINRKNPTLTNVIEKDGNQTAVSIDEDKLSNNGPKNNFAYQNESLPPPEDLKRSV